MISEATRRCFAQYAQGCIDFNIFSLRTRAFWTAVGRYLLTRWRAPDAVEIEDLVQELFVEAWRAFPKHDPARGDLTDFVCYEATSKAKRWLHGQRGRRKCSRSDKAPSRHPLRFCQVVGGDTAIEDFLESVLGSDEPEQFVSVEAEEHRRESVAIVVRALTHPRLGEEELHLLRAFVDAEGDLMRACQNAGLQSTGVRAMMRAVSRVIEGRREQRLLLQELLAEEETT